MPNNQLVITKVLILDLNTTKKNFEYGLKVVALIKHLLCFDYLFVYVVYYLRLKGSKSKSARN